MDSKNGRAVPILTHMKPRLEFESINHNLAGQFYRAKVPGGWVLASQGSTSFMPDPNHDGTVDQSAEACGKRAFNISTDAAFLTDMRAGSVGNRLILQLPENMGQTKQVRDLIIGEICNAGLPVAYQEIGPDPGSTFDAGGPPSDLYVFGDGTVVAMDYDSRAKRLEDLSLPQLALLLESGVRGESAEAVLRKIGQQWAFRAGQVGEERVSQASGAARAIEAWKAGRVDEPDERSGRSRRARLR